MRELGFDIAVYGKMRSGKDEVYKILQELNYEVNRFAFGDVMKHRFFETFPHIPREPKPIQQLIYYGQAMRGIYTNVWVDEVAREIEWLRSIEGAPNSVITDVRQFNEYEYVQNNGFILIKVEASDETRIARMRALGETPSEEVLNARTEKVMDKFVPDFIVNNDGDRSELVNQILAIIHTVQQRKGKK